MSEISSSKFGPGYDARVNEVVKTSITELELSRIMRSVNLRRKGKKAVATLFLIDQWRFHKRFRTVIERHFSWAKRYFGLNDSHCQGCVAITQHVPLVYAAMLGVALAAERYGRPDLRLSRKGLLAAKTL